MRSYKLSYAGASALGLSPVQIVASGRVKSVQMSTVFHITGVVDYGQLQVGIAAVSESGIATASPVNIATQVVSASQRIAAAATEESYNTTVPCDYPVSAGQNLQINLAGAGQAGTNWELVEVIVWVG